MKTRLFPAFFLILLLPAPGLSGSYRPTIPDSLRIRQLLYNGRKWENEFRRYNGDPFLFASYFLPGEISYNGRIFVNVKLKYDAYSDQVLIPRSLDQIIQLNREMVDSFKLVFENRLYRFVRLEKDEESQAEGFVNVLYSGRSFLCVKYIKRISTVISDHSDGSFYQVYDIYYLKEGTEYRIEKKKDLYRILGIYREQARKFIRDSRLRVSPKEPESFVPVIRFYDSIRK